MARTIGEEAAANSGVPQAMEAVGEKMYRVWACDNQVYGPIPGSTLRQWAEETRVQRDTWVFVEDNSEWRPAAKVEELHDCFPPGEETLFLRRQTLSSTGMDILELRQFPIFSGLPNHELAQLVQFAQLEVVQPGDVVMKRRDPGDAIYFVLSGSLRARIHVGREEKLLSRIRAGEFFGEMAMLAQTVRTADVVADEECRLLRISAEAFRLLIEQNPAAVAPMLYSLSSLLARRVLEGNEKFRQEVASGFVWR